MDKQYQGIFPKSEYFFSIFKKRLGIALPYKVPKYYGRDCRSISNSIGYKFVKIDKSSFEVTVV